MTLTVVPIRGNAPSLNDIPNQLRQMADRIESGEVEATSMLAIIPVEGDWPLIFGWGEDLGDYGRVGLLAIAQAWFASRLTTR